MFEPATPWVLAAMVASHAAATSAPNPRTRAAAAAPESSVPPYARSKGGAWEGAPSWLSLGLEQRMRFESRRGRLRERPEASSVDWGLSRTRLFLGIEPETHPFRFRLEVQDARQFASDLPDTPLTVDRLDLLQLGVGVDLEPLLRVPLRFELGRSSFDAVDRRLVARNRFRNTTNAFDGIRFDFGDRTSRYGVELIAAFPAEILTREANRPDDRRKLLGLFGRLSVPSATLEPYYLYYRLDGVLPRSLHTAGVHLFGAFAGGGLDHDVSAALQLGSVDEERHRAFALHAEIGRSPAVSGSPRVALWLNYASGDRLPDDGRSGRFDPLFGASHTMYGFTDLFTWQNLINPTAALSIRPLSSVGLELYYRLYWLASSKDAFVRAAIVDPSGKSGSFVGQELDVSIRYRFVPFAELELQYGELFDGGFVDVAGGGRGARVLFVSIVLGTGGG